ncbi:MAG: low molecular weight protein arginine phosphatase [Clostridia bacterium]|nr:low molecular weight protein arginine phosphatase [Clostridia bacterium]
MKKKRIIFVCTGNTCRSPMAEIILKNKLKLAGVTDITVTSAGLSATPDLKMSANSATALKKLGYKPYGFKSKQLTRKMVEKADLVLCMTAEHKRYLNGFNNVYTVGEVADCVDVFDPYGGDLAVYMEVSRIIEDACNTILNNILARKGE